MLVGAASALACALLDCPVAHLTGPGTGLNAAGVSRKAQVIERALALHGAQRGDALQTLFNLGGFEIAASFFVIWSPKSKRGSGWVVTATVFGKIESLGYFVDPRTRPEILGRYIIYIYTPW